MFLRRSRVTRTLAPAACTAVAWVALACSGGSPADPGMEAPPPDPPAPPPPPARYDIVAGADISFLPQIEDAGGAYDAGAGPRDLLEILADRGYEAIRLKLWHTPDDPYNDLPGVLAMARRIREAGLDFLLNFHYSDTWADPGNQSKPAAWASLPHEALRDSLHAYTRDVLQALADQGTTPWMVQLGNEVSPGMLWPDGRVSGAADTDAQWARFAGLLGAARQGVADGSGGAMPRIMIHYDNGAAPDRARDFFSRLVEEGVEFDVMGVSYYPHWHGTLTELEANLADLTGTLARDVYVVETAYPWTLSFGDAQTNIFGEPEQLVPGYPATPSGQAAFVSRLRRIVQEVPDGRGAGLFYWAPEWIAVDGVPSAWENAALFDFNGRALPALDSLPVEP